MNSLKQNREMIEYLLKQESVLQKYRDTRLVIGMLKNLLMEIESVPMLSQDERVRVEGKIQKRLDEILKYLFNSPVKHSFLPYRDHDMDRAYRNIEAESIKRSAAREADGNHFDADTSRRPLTQGLPSSDAETISDTPQPPGERTINAWINGAQPFQPLSLQDKYELLFRVGDPLMINLFSGPASKIALGEIPEGGLQTEWIISSTSIAVGSYAPEDKVRVATIRNSVGYAARFLLTVPRNGDSDTVRLAIIPNEKGTHDMEVVIYAWRNSKKSDGTVGQVKELYRQFLLTFNIEASTSNVASSTYHAGNLVQNDIIHAPASQTTLTPPHEWTTPDAVLNLHVIGNGQVVVSGDAGHESVNMITKWFGVSALVAGPLANLISSAEKFRANWNAYLNDLDGADIMQRLRSFSPQRNWSNLRYSADTSHENSRTEACGSPEMKAFAFDAFTLFDVFFPSGSELRAVMDKLIPGQRVNISWTPSSGAGYIPHVPWGMLYAKQPERDRIDEHYFMGLRYRIAYSSREILYASKALGNHGKSFSANLFYWDNQPNDPVYTEALWQQKLLSEMQTTNLIIPSRSGASSKQQMLDILETPDVSPLALLYLYCHCSVGDGNNPTLRFGASAAPEFSLSRNELGLTPFADRPLVFANACTTAAAEPYLANELASVFFRRQCRAYIGTEIKVPIVFASRFAFIFFSFFYRKVDAAPIAAGEAIAQARLWLWTNYRNVGGIFYNYVNQYELFMADDEELKGLRSK